MFSKSSSPNSTLPSVGESAPLGVESEEAASSLLLLLLSGSLDSSSASCLSGLEAGAVCSDWSMSTGSWADPEGTSLSAQSDCVLDGSKETKSVWIQALDTVLCFEAQQIAGKMMSGKTLFDKGKTVSLDNQPFRN